MVDHPENNNIIIHLYCQETLPTFMIAIWLFRTIT